MSSCRWSACMRCPIRWHPTQSFFAIHYGRGLGTQSLGMATAPHKFRTLWQKGTSLTFWQTFIVTWVASCILLLAIFICAGHVFAPLIYAGQRWESAHIDDAGRFQCSWPLLVVVQKYTHMLFCLPRSPADSLLGLITSGPHGCASAELRRYFFQCQTSKSWGRRICFYKCWFHFCPSFGITFAPRNWAHQMSPPDLELISSPKSRPTF